MGSDDRVRYTQLDWTPEMYRRLEAAAGQLSVSAWIRDLVEEALRQREMET